MSENKESSLRLERGNGLYSCDILSEDNNNLHFTAWALFITDQGKRLTPPESFLFYHGRDFLGSFKPNENRPDVVAFYLNKYKIDECQECGISIEISKGKRPDWNLKNLYIYAVWANTALELSHNLNVEPHCLDLYKSTAATKEFFLTMPIVLTAWTRLKFLGQFTKIIFGIAKIQNLDALLNATNTQKISFRIFQK